MCECAPVQEDSEGGCFLAEGTGGVSSSCNTPGWSTPCYRRSQTSPGEGRPSLQREHTHKLYNIVSALIHSAIPGYIWVRWSHKAERIVQIVSKGHRVKLRLY